MNWLWNIIINFHIFDEKQIEESKHQLEDLKLKMHWLNIHLIDIWNWYDRI